MSTKKQIVRFRVSNRGQLVDTLVKWYVVGVVSKMDWNLNVDLIFYRRGT